MGINVVVNSSGAAAAGAAAKTRSGLQKQVLALYRRALLAARKKDAELAGDDASRPSNATEIFVRERFRDDAASVRRVDFNVIEHLLRKGERDLKMLERMKAANFTHVPRSSAPTQ